MKDLSFLKARKIAHRGLFDNSRIYENTISAYTRAIKYNYTIEIDVRLLADGTLVCFHDETPDRLLHVDGKTDKLTYEELSYLSKYQIPTLKETLDIINGKVPLLIEVRSEYKKGKCEALIANLLDNYTGEFAIQSFNIKTLKWFYKNRPDYIIGHLVCKKNFMKDYLFKKYDFLDINILIYNDKKIRKMREDKFIIGHKICNKEEYLAKKDVYDNLVYDNLLEIDGE